MFGEIADLNEQLNELKETKQCASCGTYNDKDNEYCSKCGAPLGETVEEEPAEEAPEAEEAPAAEEPAADEPEDA